jgi:hypothetical protein
MNRLVISLLLAAFSGSAGADWVRLSSNDNLILYTDPVTIRKSGSMVKMWNLYDFKTNQVNAGYQYMSSMEQKEYDCKEEQVRILYFSWHSENMAQGKVIFSSVDLVWTPVAPSTINEALWKIACGKK